MTRKLPEITDGANPKPGECENGGVSQTSRFRGRGKDMSVSIPRGETLATFDAYASAQKLVNSLVSDGVPFRSLSIVGTDVNLVERVTGKIGYGRAALSSAMSGSWLGVLAGLVFVIVSPTDVITPIVAGGIIGAGIGMVVGMVLFTLAGSNRRSYRSMQQIIAKSYRVVVEPDAHQQALAAMKASQAGSPS